MEMVLIAILAVVVAGYYGVFELLEISSAMGADELKDKRRDQKERLIKINSKRDIDEETVVKAKTNMSLIDSIEF